MPKHRKLTVGAKVVNAGKQRKCHHDRRHPIKKGDRCLEVRDGLAWKGYCVACGAQMVAIGHSTLATLQDELGK
jgi:hypothetical protein